LLAFLLNSCYRKHAWNRKSIVARTGKSRHECPRYIHRWWRLPTCMQFYWSVFSAIVHALSAILFAWIFFMLCFWGLVLWW